MHNQRFSNVDANNSRTQILENSYCVCGLFGVDFNLAVWRIHDKDHKIKFMPLIL